MANQGLARDGHWKFHVPNVTADYHAVITDRELEAALICTPTNTHVTLFHFANGVIGTIDNSRWAMYGYDQRVEILGSQGASHTEHNYPNNSGLRPHTPSGAIYR